MTLRQKYIGDKSFYKTVILLIIPLVIQQGITNFVSLLDNLMVGSLGTEPMSGVAISNQLVFVFNLALFGGLSGASIFGAQFFGSGDYEGMRSAFRFKMYFGLLTSVIAAAIFILFPEKLILLFLDNEANRGIDISITLGYARQYLNIALIGFLPFAVVQIYAGTLREAGETVSPMIASIISVAINFILNYLLIFGSFGFPKLGVAGAAVATVIARFAEMLYIVIYSHTHTHKFSFMRGVYSTAKIPFSIVKSIAITGSPLLFNEILWSLGTTAINQNYSTRGLSVVAAMNINTTAWQLFTVIMFAMGNAVAIMVGQKLGAGEIEQARDTDRKLIFFGVSVQILMGLVIIALAGVIPMLYKTEPEVRTLATRFLMVAGGSLPIHTFIHLAYFTIRSGGKTIITFFFDCVYIWCVSFVLSWLLCHKTSLGIVTIYFIVQFSDLIKLFISVPMLRSGFWSVNIVRK